MTIRSLLLIAAAVAVVGMVTVPAVQAHCGKCGTGKALRHVVLFKWKDGTPKEDVVKIEQAFAALATKIDVIQDFEWGINNSPEGLADGFTHCFFVSFADEKGRETYLPHPDHKAFVELMKPHLDKVLVIDYWASGH